MTGTRSPGPASAAATRAASDGAPRAAPALPEPPAWLGEALRAAAQLGLPTARLEGAAGRWRERAGLTGDSYVLAFVGGTGVGKSTLLNALAGRELSRAGARRPTTERPLAWLPAGPGDDMGRLLRWLGIDEVVADAPAPDAPALVRPGQRLAILDLPDLDSVALEHRDRVDRLLPLLDAVCWVVDPEKYGDALLHRRYLEPWGGRFGRQAVLVSRADLLPPDARERLRADATRLVRAAGLDPAPVLVASAVADPPGLRELREWLGDGSEAKAVVLGCLRAEARSAVDEAARAAGVGEGTQAGSEARAASTAAHREPSVATSPPLPLLDRAERLALEDAAAAGVLEALDLRELRRQAVDATRQASRSRGAGPIGWVAAKLLASTGRPSGTADPVGHLRRWRTRASPARLADPARPVVATALERVPSPLRPSVAASVGGRASGAAIARSVDAAVDAFAADPASTVPGSAAWPAFALGITAATATFLAGVAWLAVLWIARGPEPGGVAVPVLGTLPWPLVLLGGGLLAGLVLARLLDLHARWVGRRWANRLAGAVSQAAREAARDAVLGPIDRLDAARATLAGTAAAAAAEISVL